MNVNLKQSRRLMPRLSVVAACLFLCSGCAVFRLADFVAPAIRFDHANNKPLPSRDDRLVAKAIDKWEALSAQKKRRYPTPYHVYVDTPAPGTFEGEHVVALAFSGGGTRGTVFCAAVLKELEQLGAIHAETPNGPKRIDLLAETDYVSGVSTGAIPAAAYALDQGGTCPPDLALENWPECFNVSVTAYALKHLFIRPDRILRDMTLDMNTRPTGAGAFAGVFFEGNPYRVASGLTFRDLPSTPILLLASTVVDDPGAPFIQTRLPYRYTLDTYSELPWGVGVQSFESFHSDPMPYALGEASYNSSAFPGYMRAGLMKMREDPDWLVETLDAPKRERMKRARHQTGYRHTYSVKDGGLVDNRGIEPVDRLFEHLAQQEKIPGKKPLLICFDAGYRELRTPEPGRTLFKKGWLGEVYDSSSASWRTGQQAYERLYEEHVEAGVYALARFRYVAWLPYLPKRGAEEQAPSGPASHTRTQGGVQSAVQQEDRTYRVIASEAKQSHSRQAVVDTRLARFAAKDAYVAPYGDGGLAHFGGDLDRTAHAVGYRMSPLPRLRSGMGVSPMFESAAVSRTNVRPSRDGDSLREHRRDAHATNESSQCAPERAAGTRHLIALCRQEPLIGTPERLLEVARGVGTTLGKLTEAEMAAIRITARFAVWREKDALLQWASGRYDGAPAWFEGSSATATEE